VKAGGNLIGFLGGFMSTIRRSSSSYGSFADGIIIRGMPLLTLFPGNVYWVDSNGGGGSKGTFAHPVATVAAAHALVTTDNGDIICLKPGHAESNTTVVEFSKSGFSIVGLGFGFNRPTFTNAMAANGDGFDFAGDDIVVYNVKWKEGAPAATAVTVFNVSGDNFHIENCYIQLGAKTLIFLTHDTTQKTHLEVVGNTIVGTAAGPTSGVMFEQRHSYAHITGNKWLMGASAGLDDGCVIFSSGSGIDHLLEHDVVLGFGDGDTYQLQTNTLQGGLVSDIRIVGADATDHIGTTPASGLAVYNVNVFEPGETTLTVTGV
jgi:hypothetical protein